MPTLKGRKKYPMPSKEELEKCYKELKSLKDCSKRFGVSYETLRMWLKVSGVQINAQGVNTKPVTRKTWRLKI